MGGCSLYFDKKKHLRMLILLLIYIKYFIFFYLKFFSPSAFIIFHLIFSKQTISSISLFFFFLMKIILSNDSQVDNAIQHYVWVILIQLLLIIRCVVICFTNYNWITFNQTFLIALIHDSWQKIGIMLDFIRVE